MAIYSAQTHATISHSVDETWLNIKLTRNLEKGTIGCQNIGLKCFIGTKYLFSLLKHTFTSCSNDRIQKRRGTSIIRSFWHSSYTGFQPAPLSIRSILTTFPLEQISVGFCTVLMLHCQASTSTVHDDSSNQNEGMMLLFFEWYIVWRSGFNEVFREMLNKKSKGK